MAFSSPATWAKLTRKACIEYMDLINIYHIRISGYVWIKGRQKDLIICGGLNVYPTEVEDVVTNLYGEKLKECAVIGMCFK